MIGIATALAVAVHAQQLERSVLASCGTQVQTASLMLEHTLGELVVTTAGGAGLSVTQGFHQQFDLLIGNARAHGGRDTETTVNMIQLGATGC